MILYKQNQPVICLIDILLITIDHQLDLKKETHHYLFHLKEQMKIMLTMPFQFLNNSLIFFSFFNQTKKTVILLPNLYLLKTKGSPSEMLSDRLAFV